VPARQLRSLYLAWPQRLLTVLRRVDPAVATVMVIGHNPGLHRLALQLGERGDPVLRDRLWEKYPTGALAAIKLPIDRWRDLGEGGGTLTHFITPRGADD